MKCEIPEFFNVTEPKARNQYRCCECAAPILAGEVYVYCVGKWDGGMNTYKQHLLCANACRWIRDDSDGECIGFGDLKEWAADQFHYHPERNQVAQYKAIRKMLADILRRERAAHSAAKDKL